MKVCLAGVLIALNDLLAAAYKNLRFANLRGMVVLLQSLARMVPCAHGYKAFVETEEVDTRILLMHLIRFDDDFINYWSLEVLSALCICPFSPRSTQQEFVNKHTLLTDSMLTNLVELMSTRIDVENEAVEDHQKEDDSRRLSLQGESKEVELFFPNSLVS